MNENYNSEILINATRVSHGFHEEIYEFVLNEALQVIECIRVESLLDGIIYPIEDFQSHLQTVLFELNHVRVNPTLDNTFIISQLTQALKDIGVKVSNPPANDTITMCFRPLGEIMDTVRFYFDATGQVVFLSPKVKLGLVSSQHQPNTKLRS